jgi:hypothetical protein
MQSAFLRLAERIEAIGLKRIGQPHVKHLQASGGRCGSAGAMGVAEPSTSPRFVAGSSWCMRS